MFLFSGKFELFKNFFRFLITIANIAYLNLIITPQKKIKYKKFLSKIIAIYSKEKKRFN